ncbi:MAG TPA: hypothetical protein ENO11_00405 [Desulfobacteraceae bacterium]|nr:hypothetical protein [Desulfobacteraceae bacterium]
MTKLTAFVLGFFMVLASVGIAQARHNDGLEGLVIGGVGGAAIGHVITGTPEGVIVGSVLGGTIGMLIDAGNNRHQVVYIKDRHRHYRQWPGHSYTGRWSHRGDRHYFERHGHNKRWDRRGDRWESRWDHRRDRHRGRHLR